MERPAGPVTRYRVHELRETSPGRDRTDTIVTEEPMEIRLGHSGRSPSPLVVTMRTPGADFELSAGFLYSEGVVVEPDDIRTITYCRDPDVPIAQRYNVVSVIAAATGTEQILREAASGARFGAVSSACGVCGRQSLDQLETRARMLPTGPRLDARVLRELPDRLRTRQRIFGRTGALHGAGLFSPSGEMVVVREDVGRHNAVDKIVGWTLLHQRFPVDDGVLVVSGRAGFEIVQKAVTAGVPAVVAVGAPSSLAVDLARRHGQTLVGFTRPERCVVYSGGQRLSDISGLSAPSDADQATAETEINPT